MNGACDHLEGYGLIPDTGKGAPLKVGRVLDKAEKAESLGQFHHGARFRLLRRCALSHLFPGSDDLLRLRSATTDINGNPNPPLVDAQGLLENVQLGCFEFFPETVDRLLRREDFVLVQGEGLEGIFQHAAARPMAVVNGLTRV